MVQRQVTKPKLHVYDVKMLKQREKIILYFLSRRSSNRLAQTAETGAEALKDMVWVSLKDLASPFSLN